MACSFAGALLVCWFGSHVLGAAGVQTFATVQVRPDGADLSLQHEVLNLNQEWASSSQSSRIAASRASPKPTTTSSTIPQPVAAAILPVGWWSSTKRFLMLATWVDITLMACLTTAFIVDHTYFRKFPQMSNPWVRLGLWTILGLLCWLTQVILIGPATGSKWMGGWLLELLFSLENMFVLHCIMQSFQAPGLERYTALLFMVVCTTIVQFLVFVDLGTLVAKQHWLPKALGGWLVLVGVSAAVSESDEGVVMDASEMAIVWLMRKLLGPRWFSETFSSGSFLETRMGKTTMTMLLPMVVWCSLVNCMLEMDTVLTKIEEFGGGFLQFLSSFAVVLAMPDIYLVTLDLFSRYPLMKWAIVWVLMYYGATMLLDGILKLPAWIDICVLAGSVLMSVLASIWIYPDGNRYARKQFEEALEDSTPSHHDHPAEEIETDKAAG